MEYSDRCSKKDVQEIVKIMAEEAMDKRNIAIKDILCSSIDCTVKTHEYNTVISAVSLW